MSPLLSGLELILYRIAGVSQDEEMSWKRYLKAVLIFNALGFCVVFLLQIAQGRLPFNPQHLGNVPFLLALNTAISFMTNTNWQAYAGESTLSHFVQMLGLTVQNFLSAATGIAVFLAMARGLVRREAATVGNLWIDLTRSIVYVLLPLSIILAVILACQGVVQTLEPYHTVHTIEGVTQRIPLGPAASQIAIKQLGTNGGGFFGVNSAHPLENPTPISNFFEMLAIILIPAALVITYGRMTGNKRQGVVILVSMAVMFLAGLAVMLAAEYMPNPVYGNLPLLEGKELRFGRGMSVLWGALTTAASNGSVNAVLDSLSPLAGQIAMLNIMLGEIVFGGVGAGLYGMLMFVLLTVFIAGLMVGRTPEYLGKKVEKREVQWSMAAIIIPSAVILLFSAIAAAGAGTQGLANRGPHGLSEILYAFSSAAGNNGSAFGGVPAGGPFYLAMTAVAMLMGRFIVIAAALGIAGSMAGKKVAPLSEGTFRTDGALFVILLVGIVLIVGALTFFPALTLGPIVEHLLLLRHTLF